MRTNLFPWRLVIVGITGVTVLRSLRISSQVTRTASQSLLTLYDHTFGVSTIPGTNGSSVVTLNASAVVDTRGTDDSSNGMTGSSARGSSRANETFYATRTTNATAISSHRPFKSKRRRFLYLHVGKTGGISLDRVLRSNCLKKGASKNRQACLEKMLGSELPDGELLLSQLTKLTVHVTFRSNHQSLKQYTTFFWSLRNPIDRAVSALDMRHIENNPQKFRKPRQRQTPEYYWCNLWSHHCGFNTAQDLANALDTANTTTRVVTIPKGPTTNDTKPFDCLVHGRKTLAGQGDRFSHLRWNYAHYGTPTTDQWPDREIVAVRTEHLWKDVAGLEDWLRVETGSEPLHARSLLGNLTEHQHTHGSESYAVRSTLTPRGRQVFCCFLSDEVRRYEALLLKAANLPTNQTYADRTKLYRDCGIAQNPGNHNAFDWTDWRAQGCPTTTTTTVLG